MIAMRVIRNINIVVGLRCNCLIGNHYAFVENIYAILGYSFGYNPPGPCIGKIQY